jgi:hypothetical protein
MSPHLCTGLPCATHHYYIIHTVLTEMEKSVFFNWQYMVSTGGNHILSIVNCDVNVICTQFLWLPIGTLFNNTNLAGGK